MIYVINLEDGGGKEFFLVTGDRLIPLEDKGENKPTEFISIKLALKRMDKIRPNYPPVCRLYALERNEFDRRRNIVQAEGESAKPAE